MNRANQRESGKMTDGIGKNLFLDSINTETNDKVSIMVETSYDEAVVVGTSAAYKKLAHEILSCVEVVESGNVCRELFGVNLIGAIALPSGLFDSLAHVVPSSICIVKSDDDRKKVCSWLCSQ